MQQVSSKMHISMICVFIKIYISICSLAADVIVEQY